MAVLMEGKPIIVFSTYILEGCLMPHLLMFSSFIGRVVYTGLCSVLLRDAWSMRILVVNSTIYMQKEQFMLNLLQCVDVAVHDPGKTQYFTLGPINVPLRQV